MRSDSLGFFWEDKLAEGPRNRRARPMPPIPQTGWRPPTHFPNLAAASVISIDCETKDPELEDHGPGWARNRGHIVGVSIGANSGGRWYFPMRHEVETELNIDPELVLRWLRDVLGNPNQPKVGANLIYDIGWLQQEGVYVKGELVDVQYAEALLNEQATVALEDLAQRYLGEGKTTSLLYRWCADFYGGAPTSRQRKNIYRSPPSLVGPYAEGDADLPLRIIPRQYPLLHEQGLVDLFRMECALIPLLVKMRFAGVRIDPARAEGLRADLETREKELQQRLKVMTGVDVNTNASESLARAFDRAGIPYPKTKGKKPKPSFTKPFLKTVDHPLARTILEIRLYAKMRRTFVEGYLLGAHVNGMVYGQFHPLRGDENGTRSGRFASSDPNLQNLPIRDEEWGPKIRGIFVPDEGHAAWRKYDYSQIEYRFLVHFAEGPGAEEARALYLNDPNTDYHEMTLDLVSPVAGWDVSTKEQRKLRRRPIKNINFGLIYGMGVDKLSADLGLSVKEGKALFAAYHKAVPYAKKLMDECSQDARDTGVITTILGRRSRFDLWEPEGWGGASADTIALPLNEAILKWGNIRRAYTHKALNRRLQGSAADLMKVALLKCWESGIFDEVGVPRLLVHDETDHSDPGGKDEAFREMQHILETAIPLRIPVKADYEIGPDWGHLKDPN